MKMIKFLSNNQNFVIKNYQVRNRSPIPVTVLRLMLGWMASNNTKETVISWLMPFFRDSLVPRYV